MTRNKTNRLIRAAQIEYDNRLPDDGEDEDEENTDIDDSWCADAIADREESRWA